MDGNALSWSDAHLAPRRHWRDLRRLALRQLNPLASRLSPLRYFSDWRLEGYYRRTLSDPSLAHSWAGRYLKGLSIPRGAAVLDHGCGRGRHVGLLTRLGFDVSAQDVGPHAWWTRFSDCSFQVVPAAAPRLPWSDGAFDAVLDVNVVHHLDGPQLVRLASEAFRVLSPGGFWILLEANHASYGASGPRKHYGRLHSLEHVERIVAETGFHRIDQSYEGVYAPVLPGLVNFVRKQAWPGPFRVEDFDSWLAALVPPRRRALWLLRLQKPPGHG